MFKVLFGRFKARLNTNLSIKSTIIINLKLTIQTMRLNRTNYPDFFYFIKINMGFQFFLINH